MTRGMVLTYELVASPIALALLAFAAAETHRTAFGAAPGPPGTDARWSLRPFVLRSSFRARVIFMILVFVHLMWNIELRYAGMGLGRYGPAEFALLTAYGFISHLARPAAWMLLCSFALNARRAPEIPPGANRSDASPPDATLRLARLMLAAVLLPETLLAALGFLPGIDYLSLQGLKNTATVFMIGGATALLRRSADE